MKTEYDVLMLLKEQYKFILGKKSLERLQFFIAGYSFCLKEVNGKISDESILSGFYMFLGKHFNMSVGGLHWSDIIKSNSNNEEEAFDNFFRLIEEYNAAKQLNE